MQGSFNEIFKRLRKYQALHYSVAKTEGMREKNKIKMLTIFEKCKKCLLYLQLVFCLLALVGRICLFQ